MASKALNVCLAIIRWAPVVFITAVIVWSYYAYVLQMCICEYYVINSYDSESDNEKLIDLSVRFVPKHLPCLF